MQTETKKNILKGDESGAGLLRLPVFYVPPQIIFILPHKKTRPV